jgi:5-formaminoimidazole-4-carboxamide-1-beta-D-ribofuranosyl 5'-monophosphate synthetase
MKRYGAKKGKGYFYAKANKEGKSSEFYKLAHGK